MNHKGLSIPAAMAAGLASFVEPAFADNAKYCKDDSANFVLYLDVTTPYDEIDKRSLLEGVGRIFGSLSGGERLSIRTIEDAFPNSRRLIDDCVPVCDAGMLGDLFADCTEGAATNDKKMLARRIVDSIGARLAAASELPFSEIIRTVSLSSAEEYRKGRKNTFFIFSDMIENSPFLPGRKFFSEPDGAIIEKLAEQRLIPELWEAEVRVFGIGRTGSPDGRNALTEDQRQKIVGFWTKYFAASGASVSMHQNLVAD